jgi:aldehyde dehydrogenase (NAD+)
LICGWVVQSFFIGTDKRITLELGGKAANIVFEDAPIDQAIEGIIAGIYFNMGHICCAGSRRLVREGVFPTVVKKLRDRIQTLRIGNPLDKNTDIGTCTKLLPILSSP